MFLVPKVCLNTFMRIIVHQTKILEVNCSKFLAILNIINIANVCSNCVIFKKKITSSRS